MADELQQEAIDAILKLAEHIQNKPEKVTPSQLYMKAKEFSQVWRSTDDELFADLKFGDAQIRTVNLEADFLRSWLRHLYQAMSGEIATDQCIERVVAEFRADATFSKERHKVHLRIAKGEEAIYVDRCVDKEGYIKVTKEGWSLTESVPMRFSRSKNMRELPVPLRRSNLRNELQPFLSTKNERDITLLIGYLMGLVMPQGPYPVLMITGEHGAAKSTTIRLLRRIIDPHNLDMRAPFNDRRDFVAAIKNSYVLAFDNVSYISNWLSDDLCSLATGTKALGGRTLYTNDGESGFWAMRPIMTNGIPEFVRQPDLADRVIRVHLKQIEEYRHEGKYWEEFEAAWPYLFGALLDCMVASMADNSADIMPGKLRMQNFVQWTSGGEVVAGFERGAMVRALLENKKDASEAVVEFSVLADSLRRMIEMNSTPQNPYRFEGALRELRNEVAAKTHTDVVDKLPKTMDKFLEQLKKVTPALREVGIVVKWHGRSFNKGTYKGNTRVEVSCE